MKLRVPFVHNVRRGLATNSSSSHSLVYFDEPRPDHDDGGVDVQNIDVEFGWDDFRLTTRREKLMYALVSILSRDGLNVGWASSSERTEEQDALRKYMDMFPELASEMERASHGYIDHQSATNPERLLKAAMDPHVEIWGGNDNSSGPFEVDDSWNPIPPPGANRVEELN